MPWADSTRVARQLLPCTIARPHPLDQELVTGYALLLCQAKGAAESLRKFDYPPVGAVSISYPLSAIREDRKDSTGQLPGALQAHCWVLSAL
jgi:hypothetical protein